MALYQSLYVKAEVLTVVAVSRLSVLVRLGWSGVVFLCVATPEYLEHLECSRLCTVISRTSRAGVRGAKKRTQRAG